MINATSVDSIPRLSFRKRNANHLLPSLQSPAYWFVTQNMNYVFTDMDASNFLQKAGEIWIENEQQSSTKN